MMDSVDELDPTLPVDFDNSIQPHLLGTDMAAYLELHDGSVPMVTKTNTGRMSPIRARTMKEYDQQLCLLKKENFDLKLRIFHMQQQKHFADSNDVYNTNVELNVLVENLRKDVSEKSDLLQKASSAIRSLSGPQDEALSKLKEEHAKEITRLKQHLESQINHQTEELHNKEFRAMELDRMVKELEAGVARLEEEKSEQDRTIAELNATLKLRDSLIEDLRETVKSKDAVLSNQKSECRALSDSLNDARTELERSGNDNKQLKHLLNEASNERCRKSVLVVTNLQDDITELNKKIADLEKAVRNKDGFLSDKDTMIGKLEDMLREREKEKQESVEAVKAHHAKIEELNKVQAVQLKMIQGLVVAQKKKESDMKIKIDEFDELRKVRDNLQRLQDMSIKEVSKQQSDIHDRDASIQTLNKQLELSAKKLQSLEESLAKERQRCMDVTEQRTNTQTLLEEAQLQLDNKEKLLQQFTDSLKEKDKQLQQYIELLKPNPSEQSKDVLLKQLQEKLKEMELSAEKNITDKFLLEKEKERENEKLRQTLREREVNLERGNALLQTAQDTIHTLEQDGRDATRENKRLSLALRAAHKSLEEEQACKESIIDEKEATIASLKKCLESRNKTIEDTLNKSLESDASKLIQLQEGLAIKEKMMEEVVGERNRAEEMLRRTHKEMSVRISQRDEDYRQLQAKHTEDTQCLEKTLQNLRNEHSKLERQFQEAQSQLRDSEAQTAELSSRQRATIADKDRTIDNLAESSQEKDKLLRTAQNSLLKAQTEIRTNAESVSEMKAELFSRYATISDLQQKIVDYQQKIGDFQARLGTANQELEKFQVLQREMAKILDELRTTLRLPRERGDTPDILSALRDIKAEVCRQLSASDSRTDQSETGSNTARRMYGGSEQPIYINVTQTATTSREQTDNDLLHSVRSLHRKLDVQHSTSVASNTDTQADETRAAKHDDRAVIDVPLSVDHLYDDPDNFAGDLDPGKMRGSQSQKVSLEAKNRDLTEKLRESLAHNLKLQRCLGEQLATGPPGLDAISGGMEGDRTQRPSQIPTLRRDSKKHLSKSQPEPYSCASNGNVADFDQVDFGKPEVMKNLLAGARSQIENLERKLLSTEATVRSQGKKIKFYKSLAENGAASGVRRWRSESCLLEIDAVDGVDMSPMWTDEEQDSDERAAAVDVDMALYRNYGETDDTVELKDQINVLQYQLRRLLRSLSEAHENEFESRLTQTEKREMKSRAELSASGASSAEKAVRDLKQRLRRGHSRCVNLGLKIDDLSACLGEDAGVDLRRRDGECLINARSYINEIKQVVKSLSASLESNDARDSSMPDLNQDLLEKYEDSQKEIARLRSDVKEMSRELSLVSVTHTHQTHEDLDHHQSEHECSKLINESLRDELSVMEKLRLSLGNTMSLMQSFSSSDQSTMLQKYLEEIRATRLRLEQSLEKSDNLNQLLEQQLSAPKESDAHISRLETEVMKKTKVIQENADLIQTYKSSVDAMSREISELKIQCETAISTTNQTEVEKLTVINRQLSADLQKHRNEVDALRKVIVDKEAVICERNDYEKLVQQNQQLNAAIEKYKSTIADLKKSAAIKDEADRAKSDVIAKYEAELREMKTQLEEKSKLMASKQNLIVEKENLCEQREMLVTKLRETSTKYEVAYMKSVSETKQLKEQINTLKEQMNTLKEQVAENQSLNRTLTYELEIQARLHPDDYADAPAAPTTKGFNVLELLKEMKHLRVQLERCIESNNAMRSKLDQNLAKTRPADRTRDYAMTSNDLTMTSNDLTSASRELPRDQDKSERNLPGHSIIDLSSTIRSHVTNGSDGHMNLLMSLEGGTAKKLDATATSERVPNTAYGSSWPGALEPPTSINTTRGSAGLSPMSRSLPPQRVDRSHGNVLLYDSLDISSIRDDGMKQKDAKYEKGEGRLVAMTELEGYELMKKENDLCRVSLSGLRARIKDRLTTLRQQAPLENMEYSTMKELAMTADNLKVCLSEETRLLTQFWVSQLPGGTTRHEDYKKLLNENAEMKEEMRTLIQNYEKLSEYAADAQRQLEETNRRKERNEDALCRALGKTDKVLRQANANFLKGYRAAAKENNPRM